MKVAIISAYYPSQEDLYSGGFVHIRVKNYIKRGHDCKVFVLDSNVLNGKYFFEDVEVFKGEENFIVSNITSYNPQVLCIHCLLKTTVAICSQYFTNIPKIIWVHGAELMWTSFLYPYDGNILLLPVNFTLRFVKDLIRRNIFRKFIIEQDPHLVFVSDYLRKQVEYFLGFKVKRFSIIPNPIDDEIFYFSPRRGKINKLICVRSLNSSKYAVDLVIKAFRKSKYHVVIYGRGKLLDYYKKLAQKYNANVEFVDRFLTQSELSELYRQYNLGIMLTRLDAQGVSVCEQNMTGLPVITSDIEGNKEFETGGTIRIKNNELWRIEKIIDQLNEEPERLEEMSYKAHEDILRKAGKEKVIEEELFLISRVVSQKSTFT